TTLFRSLPSTGIARFQRYCEPLRHPSAPDLSLTGVRLIIPDHASGLPVLRALSMLPPLPRCSSWAYSSLISPGRISLPRKGCRVGLHIVLFEACSAFTRVAACTLARSPIRDPLSEGFRHFVSSMPAPVASGWSESPGGACTRWKAPPCYGAHPLRTVSASSQWVYPLGTSTSGGGKRAGSCRSGAFDSDPSQLDVIGYFAKISSTRLNAFSAAACGVARSRMISDQAVGQTCSFWTWAEAGWGC